MRTRPAVVAAWLCVAACAAGCASAAGSTATSRPTPAPARATAAAVPRAATATSARLAEQHEAHRLLSLVTLPAGNAPEQTAPAALRSPAMGTVGARSVVDVARIYRVPLPLTASMSWLTAHPPRGLSPEGSSSAGGPGATTVFGVAYGDDRTSTVWMDAQVQISVAPRGSSSTWRVDASVLWLDPRSQPDALHGPRLAITVAAGCPGTDRGDAGVAATPATPASSLVPAAAPTGALVCRYGGTNGAAFALRADRRLAAAQARRLAVVAAHVSLAHVDGGVTNCPADDGSATAVAFSYRGGLSSALWVRTTGCESVANGRVAAPASASLGRLAAAVAAASKR